MKVFEPFFLSLIAGSASGLGGLIVFAYGRVGDRLMGFLLGFAGGVMLVVSFLELFVESLSLLSHLEATAGFVVGALLMMVIDLIMPHMERGSWEEGVVNPRLVKTGLMIAIGISLHNLPEGLVVSAGYTRLPRLGLLVTIMIGLHNIPEGIATAIPLASGGLDKSRAARIAFLSGMTEPVGALLGSAFISLLGGGDHIIGMCLAFAAGVMTYITVDELIPVAHEYCSITHKHIVSSGLLIGMLLGHVLSVVLNI
jgi:ZIP family zinc transporter